MTMKISTNADQYHSTKMAMTHPRKLLGFATE